MLPEAILPAAAPSLALLCLAAPAVGSHLALLADRLPAGRPVLWGRSACDGCGRALAARDLAPLLSWALLRGRARCCGAPLRAFLPGMELAALAVALWAAAVVEGPALGPTVLLGWALLTLAVIDARTLTLPDALTLPLVAGGLAAALAGLTGPPAAHLAGALLGYGALAALGLAHRRLRGVEGVGGGDARLLAAAGAWLGPAALPGVLGLAAALALAGLAASTAMGRPRGSRRAGPVAFGPALAAAIWLGWLYGAPGWG